MAELEMRLKVEHTLNENGGTETQRTVVVARADRWLARLDRLRWKMTFPARRYRGLSFTTLAKTVDALTLYRICDEVFATALPEEIRQHRRFFAESGRGFGENAFHAMWWYLFEEFRPTSCLEIGVHRGQTCSLWGLIGRLQSARVAVHAISPFDGSGDSVSRYENRIDYEREVIAVYRQFAGAEITPVRAWSTDATARSHITARKWDVIYIDGSHDYDVVRQDVELAAGALAAGGILVMDDSSLYRDIRFLRGAFRGHPGPSRVAQEVADVLLRRVAIVGHNTVYTKG